MNIQSVKTLSTIVLLMILLVIAAAQLDKKPYTEWSEKEALKMLNDSAWGQTQTATDLSNVTGNSRSSSPQTRISDVSQVDFRIRFFSAKPIRQAISRS